MSDTVKSKASALLLLPAAVGGCGPAAVDNSLNSLCSKPQTTASQLLLTATPASVTTAGLGYLDIHTTDAAGSKLSRRCTVSLWPRDANNTEVDVFTSGHCFFKPDSEEYKNSTFILQVAHNGGYFPVEAKMPIQEVFGAFSRSLSQFSDLLPNNVQNRLNEAIDTEMLSSCQSGTQSFAEELGASRKTIACFGKNESRSVHFVLSPRKEHVEWLEKVFEASRENIKRAFSMLPAREQKIIQLRLDSKKYQNTLELNLKNFAYLINEKHCNTAKATAKDAGFVELQTKSLCGNRSQILPVLPSILKEWYAGIESIVEAKSQTLDELKALNSELFSCRFNSLADLNVDSVKSLKTVCEVELLSRLIWDHWVAPGPENLMRQFALDINKLSTADMSIFSIKTNSLDSVESVGSEQVGKSRPFVAEVSDAHGRVSHAGLNKQAIMYNFDANANNLFLMKKDSGSALNFLNAFPLATLTTLDGNPTSGGAGVLPLPPVQDEPNPNGCE